MLMVLDTLAVLLDGRRFRRRRRTSRAAADDRRDHAALAALLACWRSPPDAVAQDAKPGDAEAIDAISTDPPRLCRHRRRRRRSISRAGLAGLTRFPDRQDRAGAGRRRPASTSPRTSWPSIRSSTGRSIAEAPMPSARRDRPHRRLHAGRAARCCSTRATSLPPASTTAPPSPATERLRDILANLNVPPLEPVPADHVLTKSFFILPEFPGRFNGSPLWVEARSTPSNADNRPVRTGDGVTPIMITANDFAGAWAVDENGDAAVADRAGGPDAARSMPAAPASTSSCTC